MSDRLPARDLTGTMPLVDTMAALGITEADVEPAGGDASNPGRRSLDADPPNPSPGEGP